jgi:hypothetical protein
VTELLGGFAGMVRFHTVRKLEAQTALLALFTFISICATWIDAWGMLQSVSLNFSDLWAPILLATAYYLAAAVVFPRDHEQYAHLHMYFAARKRFVVAMLWAAVLLETYASRAFFADALQHRPPLFWAWLVPYNAAIYLCFAALLLVRSRRANIALLVAQILLLLVPYWNEGVIDRLAMRLWGY